MEAYPREYVEHNLPLVLLSGFGEQHTESASPDGTPRQESGTRLHTSSPECRSEQAQLLLQNFLHFDGTQQSWNANDLPGPSGTLRYRVKTIGRVGTATAT